jgi:Protein of unknown function (DUF1524)
MGFMRPVLLAVARKFSPREADRAFRVIIRVTVRILIAGGASSAARSGTVEEALGDIAKKVAGGSVKTAASLLTQMDAIAPKDAKFVEAFSTASSSKPQFARYYLQAIEATWKKIPHPLSAPDDKTKSLEHVLPIHPGASWPQFTEDEADTFYRRLGNLTMLEIRLNSELRSDSFGAKKVYATSVSPLTRQIASVGEWGKEQIIERQRALAEIAAKTWPLSAD